MSVVVVDPKDVLANLNKHIQNQMKINDNPHEEEGIHMHCLTCYKSSCTKFKNCPVTHCAHCSVKLHHCKLQEHAHVCVARMRPCVNQSNGCPFQLDSVSMLSHLEVCPASVIHCGMNWNRHPLYSRVRQQWLPFTEGNPVQIAGDLDTELAISDQLHLHREMAARMRKGKFHIRDKRLKTRIDKGRMRKLDALLNNNNANMHAQLKLCGDKEVVERSCESNNCESNNCESNNCESNNCEHFEQNGVISLQCNINGHQNNEDVVGDDDEYDVVDVPLVTYDDAMSSKSDLATCVSNTSQNEAYCSLPDNYVNGGNYVCELITRISPRGTGKYPACISDLTKEDHDIRMEIYARHNITHVPLGLNVIVEKLPKFQRQYPLYSFSCSKTYRRDQYPWHCQNIHNEIQDNLNGNLFSRCPMTQYGCPFLQFNLRPEYGKVRFCKPFSSFTSTFDRFSSSSSNNNNVNNNREDDFGILDLHYDILMYMLSFLDNMSLNCLAKTCHAMKHLCYEVLDREGVVIPIWTKKTYANGGSSWQIERMVKLFTTSCSPIRKWVHTRVPAMGQHLAQCEFYKKHELLNERVKLPVCGLNIDIPSILKVSRRNSRYELIY